MASTEATAHVVNIMNQPERSAPARLLSLDAFRGLTMLLMVLLSTMDGRLLRGLRGPSQALEEHFPVATLPRIQMANEDILKR